MSTVTYYVGAITTGRQRAQDGRVACRGYDMDNGRKVRFLATQEALQAYYADDDEDAYIDVQDADITWMSKRDGGRDLWSCAGIVPAQEPGA